MKFLSPKTLALGFSLLIGGCTTKTQQQPSDKALLDSIVVTEGDIQGYNTDAKPYEIVYTDTLKNEIGAVDNIITAWYLGQKEDGTNVFLQTNWGRLEEGDAIINPSHKPQGSGPIKDSHEDPDNPRIIGYEPVENKETDKPFMHTRVWQNTTKSSAAKSIADFQTFNANWGFLNGDDAFNSLEYYGVNSIDYDAEIQRMYEAFLEATKHKKSMPTKSELPKSNLYQDIIKYDSYKP